MEKFQVKGWKSLSSYRIGVRRGIRLTNLRTQGMNRYIVNSNERLFHILDAERIDIIAVSLMDGLKILRKLNFPKIKVLSPPVESLKMYHYLHKKHYKLVPKINAVLQVMQKEGLIQQIRKQELAKLRK
jgi:polar amino acid transport system substrate-binding protein